jgi:hypothetical protein
MDLRRCPKCFQRRIQLLDLRSRYGDTWYFTCNQCTHLWSTPKTEAATPRDTVAPFLRLVTSERQS